MELESRRLRGYGDLPDGFAEQWDAVASRLLDHLQRLTEATHPGVAFSPHGAAAGKPVRD